MMDTVLNLGLNDATVRGLAAHARRALRVRQLPALHPDVRRRRARRSRASASRRCLEARRDAARVDHDTELAAAELDARWSRDFLAHRRASTPARRSRRIPSEQLWGAVARGVPLVGQRARAPLPPPARHPGVARHRRQRAGDGVRQHGRRLRDRRRVHARPDDGARVFYGEYLDERAGRGRRGRASARRSPINAHEPRARPPRTCRRSRRRCRAPYRELVRIAARLERHYRDMQDIEFTIQRGRLWLLQTRTGKRTARAAVRIAVDMVRERRITPRARRSRASIRARSTSSCTRRSIRTRRASRSRAGCRRRRARRSAWSCSRPTPPRRARARARR